MFRRTDAFNRNLNKWDTAKVNTMTAMFSRAMEFNGDISKWDVKRVTNMESMFSRALIFAQDLSKWNVSKVTSYDNFDGGKDDSNLNWDEAHKPSFVFQDPCPEGNDLANPLGC